MIELYESVMRLRIKRLRHTAIACLVFGAPVVYALLAYDRLISGLLVAVATAQAAGLSTLMMRDLQHDLHCMGKDTGHNAPDPE